MNLAYQRASRFPYERSDREGGSVVMAPVVDMTTTETSLLLRCDHPATVSVCVSGNPCPAVTWFVGSRKIQDSPEFRVSMDTGGRKQILSISRVTEELEHGIRMEAVNFVGSDQIQINVKTYKLLTGRLSSELTRSATLPLGHRYRFQPDGGDREDHEVKTIRYKRFNRFQMTQEDYEHWEQEMESRSHMRSIDDIIDSISDKDSDENPENESLTKSCDENYLTPTKTPPPPPSAPGPPPRPNETHLSTTPVPPNPTYTPNVHEMKFAEDNQTTYKSPLDKTKDNNFHESHSDESVWEMFGLKLSEFCQNILSPNTENSGPVPVSTQIPVSSRIQARSLPVERKHLGSQPQNLGVKFPVYSEVGKTTTSRQGAMKGSHLHRDQGKATVPGEKKKSPTVRPPLAPKPSFSELKSPSLVPGKVISSPCIPRSLSGDPQGAVRRSTSLSKSSPRENAVEAFLQPDVVNKIPTKDTPSLPMRPSGLDLTSNRKFTAGETQHPVGKPLSSTNPGQQHRESHSNLQSLRATNIEETHFVGSPRQVSVPKGHTLQNTNSENSLTDDNELFIDDTKTRSTEGMEPRSAKESVRKKPPVAKDKPFWSPTMSGRPTSEGIPRQGHSITPHERRGIYPGVPSNKPPISVRRVRSQSSGKTDELMEEISDSPGLITVSTSARQLSCCPETEHFHVEHFIPEDNLGKLHPSATKSEGLLTSRKLTLSVPDHDLHNGRREWRSVLPVSRSVDVLDSGDMEATPRIGRRSLSKEWNVVTVTTKEEIIILRRPPPSSSTKPTSISSTKVDNSITWKLPIGSSRPFAV